MRYNNEEIRRRLSDKTVEGMTLKIDDLAAIGRVMSIQDDAYEEQFEDIFKALKSQQDINNEILSTLRELKSDIIELKAKVSGLETKINELGGKVDKTQDEMGKMSIKVDCLDKDVQKLKRINSPWYYAVRIAIGIGVGIVLVGLIFGLF